MEDELRKLRNDIAELESTYLREKLEASVAEQLVVLRHVVRQMPLFAEEDLPNLFKFVENVVERMEDVIGTSIFTRDDRVLQANKIADSMIKPIVDAAKQLKIAAEKPWDTHRTTDDKVRTAVYGLTNGRCSYCGGPIALHDFNVEHVVPRAHGGPDNIANYVPSCAGCNQSKRDVHVLTFIQKHLPWRMDARPDLKVVNGGATPYVPERFGDNDPPLSRKDLAAGESAE